jgi:Rieske Fe-S protein
MKRNEFVKQCGTGCISLLIAPSILQACAGVKYLQAPIQNNEMILPLSSFKVVNESGTSYLPFIVAENESLRYPVCVYRADEATYEAVWMRCTHRGTELRAYGDRLQCPAHGSEFTKNGAVQNGPADEPLKTFIAAVDGDLLKINLSMT